MLSKTSEGGFSVRGRVAGGVGGDGAGWRGDGHDESADEFGWRIDEEEEEDDDSATILLLLRCCCADLLRRASVYGRTKSQPKN